MFKKEFFVKIASAILMGWILVFGLLSQANSATITWQDEAFSGINGVLDNSNFDSGEITFTPFSANVISAIDSGSYYNSYGVDTYFYLSLLLNGDWVVIADDFIPGTNIANQDYTDIDGPIFFDFGIVSGMRLVSTSDVDNGINNHAFHFSPSATIAFDTVSAVPVPAALPLFGTGLVVLGFMGWRRKRKAA